MSDKTAQVLINRTTGSAKLRIHVDLGGLDVPYIDIGLTTLSVPLTAIEDNPIAAFRTRQAIQAALAGPVRVKYAGKSCGGKNRDIADAISDMVIQKVRSTL